MLAYGRQAVVLFLVVFSSKRLGQIARDIVNIKCGHAAEVTAAGDILPVPLVMS